MSATLATPVVTTRVLNVPNTLTLLRLVLALAVGVLIEVGEFLPALVVFVLAASTDFADGWWARKFNQVTKLGRILDPFVDKIIITAALVALVGAPGSQVPAWMVTVIIGRELLITSLRAMVESSGGDFSARWLGKWKMVVQCAAIVASLLLLHNASELVWLQWLTIALIWSAVIITLGSGWDYVVQAIKSTTPQESSC